MNKISVYLLKIRRMRVDFIEPNKVLKAMGRM